MTERVSETVERRVVIYQPVVCPNCESTQTKVYGSHLLCDGSIRIRHHKCLDCNYTFKSTENKKS